MRSDADDGVDRRANAHFLADDRGSTPETPLPPSVAGHRYRAASGNPVVILAERPAQDRIYSERRKERPGNQMSVDLFRFRTVADGTVRRTGHARNCRDIGESAAISLNLAIEGKGEELPTSIGQFIHDSAPLACAEQNQLSRILDRKVPQQKCIHQTEDGRVCADPESES